MEFKLESWDDFMGKKIYVMGLELWKEGYVTEDGIIFTGKCFNQKQMDKINEISQKKE